MGLISREKRGGARSAPRQRETLKTGSSGNKNRRNAPRLPKKSVSFKGVGKFLNWAGTLCLCLVVLGAISVGLLYGYRYLTNSAYFSVKSLDVAGNFRLPSREVLDNAGLYEGQNALLVSIDTVERKIADNPWIEKVSVKRVLPDGFRIRIVEKEPKFWVRHQGTLYYADAVGVPIVAVSPGKFASFPTLEVEPGAEDLKARLPELMASLTKSRLAIDVAAISLVRLSPGRGVEVFLENSRLVLCIGQEEWAGNLGRLAATLADLVRRGEMKEIREVRAHGAGVWVIKKRPVA
ncbi:MAG: Cell division protein FtsQ [Desulfovibrio sp.]